MSACISLFGLNMFKSVIGLVFIIACNSPEVPLDTSVLYNELLPEEYSWMCRDYEEYTEIDIWYTTCDDVGSLSASYRLITGRSGTRDMDREEDCVYATSFIFEDEVCMQVEGITVIEEYVF